MFKLNTVVLCFFTVVLFFSCSLHDEIPNSHNHTHFNENGIKVRFLKGNEVTPYKNQLLKEIKKSNAQGFSLEIGKSYRTSGVGEIDYSEILEVIDTTGVANYTFRVRNHPDDNAYSFHNLVLSQEGSEQKITLLKYEYQNQATEFKNFVGQVTAKNLSNDVTNPCDPIITSLNIPISEIGPTSGANSAVIVPVGPNNGQSNITPIGNLGLSGGGGGNSNGLSVSNQPVMFQCNSCNFSTTSWDAYNNHRDANGNLYSFTIVLNFRTANNQIAIDDPCDPVGSIGVLEDTTQKTPCEELQKLLDNNHLKQALVSLDQVNEGNKEYGFAYKKNSAYQCGIAPPVAIPSVPGDNHSVDFSNHVGGDYIGGVHCHTNPANGGVQMFSFDDINLLFNFARKHQVPAGVKKDYSEYFLGGTFTTGQYCLKIKDKNNFFANFNSPEFSDKLVEAYQNLKNEDNLTKQNLEKTFLKLLSKYNFGLGLYIANEQLTKWNEIVLNDDEIPTEIPCN